MPGRGGRSTQSGISYQNLYAAYHAAEMLGGEAVPEVGRIIAVRSEAPAAVDDVVLTFADGHRRYAQAKEAIALSGDKWRKVWRDFQAQFQAIDFNRDADELHLVVGDDTTGLGALAEAFERIRGMQSLDEWYNDLPAEAQKLWREKIAPLLHLRPGDLWAWLRRVRVLVRRRETFEADGLRLLPTAYDRNHALVAPSTLWSLLVARVTEVARDRVELTAANLCEWLSQQHGIRLTAAPPVAEVQRAVQSCSAVLRSQRHQLGHAGPELPRPVTDEILAWLRVPSWGSENIAVLLDGPGRGKTVVMRRVLAMLEEEGVPVLAIKADLQLGDLESGRAIHQCAGVGLPAPVEDVMQWLARGRGDASTPVVVLIDQVDALSQSMARDTRALEAVAVLIARLRGLRQVRVLLACRTFDLNTTPELQSLDIKRRFSLPEFTDEEVASMLNGAGIEAGHLVPSTRRLLQVPLHLDLFLLAVESEDGSRSVLSHGGDAKQLRSLQDLYGLLWDRFVASTGAVSTALIPTAERVEVVRRMAAHMEQKQKTTVPQSLFETRQSEFLLPAVRFLASAGILQAGGREWSFLHQTFYDYCHARFFVEDERDLAREVLEGPQGLTERPLLKNVLSYLRVTDEAAYASAMMQFGVAQFFGEDAIPLGRLRVHLRELLRAWFGALPSPTDLEWRWVRGWLQEPLLRNQFLFSAGANPAWFERLQSEHIPRWVKQLDRKDFDSNFEGHLFWYLRRVNDDPAVQSALAEMLKPYLNRSEQWDSRLTNWLGMIRKWHSLEAIALYEELLLKVWDGDTLYHYSLREIAKQHPLSACRIVHRVLAFILDRMRATLQEEEVSFFSNPFSEFEDHPSGGLRLDDEVLDALAEQEPNAFLEAVWEFFEAVLPMGRRFYGKENRAYFPSDAFDDVWAIRTMPGMMMRHHFGFALAKSMQTALHFLAKNQPQIFLEWARRLSSIPIHTPQMLVCDGFRAAPEHFASAACDWLLDDDRRLDLGTEQWESRRLLREIMPHLSPPEVTRLEEFILAYWPLRYYIESGLRDMYLLRSNGVGQWRLLRTLGRERLSDAGRRRLREWDDKFCDWKMTDVPCTGGSGFVGSPLDGDVTRKMSDRDWLHAMAHYRGQMKHRDSMSLRGGSQQLAPLLKTLTTEQPERFARLALDQVPLDVDGFYIKALAEGLAASLAPGEEFFAVVRRFTEHNGPDIFQDVRRTLAGALEERASDKVPDDLVQWLEARVTGPPPERESEQFHQAQQESKDPHEASSRGRAGHYDTLNGGAYMDYMNSTRGKAFSALMAALRGRGEGERQWHWIERMTKEKSNALRAGAVEELTAIEPWDAERGWRLFVRLCNGHQSVLRSHFTHQVLCWACYHFPNEVEPFMRELLNDPYSNIAEEGAKIGCVLALRDDNVADEALWNELRSGPVYWRCGVAEVLSNSVTLDVTPAKRQIFITALTELLNDEDDEVQRKAAHWAYALREEHIATLSPLIEALLASRAYEKGDHGCHKFLWKYGDLRPEWTMRQVETILHHVQGGTRRRLDISHELARCVLRLYALPETDESLRNRAIEAFGLLAERDAADTDMVLREWDEGRYL